jgi:hypothetical protein
MADVWAHTMKQLPTALHGITLALIVACSGRGSEQPELEKAGDEANTPRPEPPASGEAPPTASVRDKLTCPTGCVKISATAPSPACCNCKGQDRTWKRASWSPTTWLCQ